MSARITPIHAECYIMYRNQKDEESFRHVTFRKIIEKPPETVLLAFCHLVGGYRSFKIKGLEEVVDLLTGNIYGKEKVDAYFQEFLPDERKEIPYAWKRGEGSDEWNERLLNRDAVLRFGNMKKPLVRG